LDAKGFNGRKIYEVFYFKDKPHEICIQSTTYNTKQSTYEDVIKKLGKICEKDEDEE